MQNAAAEKPDILFVFPNFGWIKSILFKPIWVLPGIKTYANCNENDYEGNAHIKSW